MVNTPLFAYRAIAEVPEEKSIAVYLFTRGQLSDTGANVFIKHMANGIFTAWASKILRASFCTVRETSLRITSLTCPKLCPVGVRPLF